MPQSDKIYRVAPRKTSVNLFYCDVHFEDERKHLAKDDRVTSLSVPNPSDVCDRCREAKEAK